MRKTRRFFCYSLILIVLLQYSGLKVIHAATNPPQPAPEKLRVEAPDTSPNSQPPIGYNEFD